MNTILNALVAYIAARLDGKDGPLAYTSLGLFGGDDGLTRPSFKMEPVARKLGLTLKSTTRWPGTPISFLGRYFNPWDGSTLSVYDPIRFFTKIQHSPDKVQDAVQIVKRKIASYLITDFGTPWVMEAYELIVKNYGPLPQEVDIDIDTNYYAYLTAHTQQAFTSIGNDNPPTWVSTLQFDLLSEYYDTIPHLFDDVKVIDGVPTLLAANKVPVPVRVIDGAPAPRPFAIRPELLTPMPKAETKPKPEKRKLDVKRKAAISSPPPTKEEPSSASSAESEPRKGL